MSRIDSSVATRTSAEAWSRIIPAAAAFVALVALAGLARLRWYDRDEGFYAMAAALVRAGWHPWRDFAYPQGPLLPFLLAPFGTHIAALRVIPVLLTALLTLLLVRRLTRRGSAAAGVGGALLLLGCPFLACWMPTLKTYAPAGVLSVGAALLVTSNADAWRGRGGNVLRGALAGLLIGLAAAIRVPCLVLAPLCAGWLVVTAPPERPRWQPALLLLGATAVVVAAACLATGASLDQMRLNALRTGLTTNPHPVTQRLNTLLELARDPAALWLVALGLTGLFVPLDSAPRAPGASRLADHHLAGFAAIVLTVGYLMAVPAFTQYFTFAVPFWAWSAAPLWPWVQARSPRLRAAAWGVAALGCLVGWAAWGPRIWRSPYAWQHYFAPAEVANVQAAIAARVPAGTPTLSTWPGFLAGTRVTPWPGLESTVSFELAAHLAPEQRKLVRIVSVSEVRELLSAGTPDAVVLTTEDQEWYGFDPTQFTAYEAAYASERVVLLVKRGR